LRTDWCVTQSRGDETASVAKHLAVTGTVTSALFWILDLGCWVESGIWNLKSEISNPGIWNFRAKEQDELMIIVAADTSTQAGSVALRKSGGKVLEEPLPKGRPHSETLLPAIDALLAASGVKRRDVTALAVGVGPGAFTGLRVGLATVKGWAMASSLQLAPVPSLDAVAFPLLARGESVLVCGDARKGELYAAFYPGMDDDGLPRCEGDVALIKPQSLLHFCRERSVRDVAVVGTGLDLVRETVKEVAGLTPGDDAYAHPGASAVLSLGERLLSLGRSVEPSQLVPCYVRAPDVVDTSHVP